MDDNRMTLNWINIGIVCGLLVSFIYPAVQFISNLLLGVILSILMGLLLSLASVGLYYFIVTYKKTITAKIALFSNIIAGVLLLQMFLVQLAIKSSKPDSIVESGKWIWNSFNHIHYGLDVQLGCLHICGNFTFRDKCLSPSKTGKNIFNIRSCNISANDYNQCFFFPYSS